MRERKQKSPFSDFLSVSKQRIGADQASEEIQAEVAPSEETAPEIKETTPVVEPAALSPTLPTEPSPAPTPPRIGRPRAKRSNPNYEQVTAYVKKETYIAARIELLKEGQREFSELIQEALEEYLRRRGVF
jgi:hypothetical protein